MHGLFTHTSNTVLQVGTMTWMKHFKHLIPKDANITYWHGDIPKYFEFSKPEYIPLKKYLKENGYFVFTFVRHPFDRLVSAYLDKIAGDPKHYQLDRRKIVAMFNDGDQVPFDHFIKFVVSEVKRFLDCKPKGPRYILLVVILRVKNH